MNFDHYQKKYGVTIHRFIDVSNSTVNSTEAANELGIPHKTYARIAKRYGVFKGKKRDIVIGFDKNEIPLAEILAGLHPTYKTSDLKKRLVEAGLKKHECEWCGISTWRDEYIALQLDHINGNNSDHSLVNLRVLCPNCHTQTPTYGSKNRTKSDNIKASIKTVAERGMTLERQMMQHTLRSLKKY